MNSKPIVPSKCHECKQLLDDPDLRLFPGDPDEAVSLFSNSFSAYCNYFSAYCNYFSAYIHFDKH